VLRAFDVKGPVVALTLRIPALVQVAPGEPRRYVDLISVPVSTRDLAVIIPGTVTAAHVLDVAREAGGDLVRAAEVFDHYAGDQVPEGKVSLAVRLTIAEPGRTLTDEEIDAVTERTVGALRDQVGAELRS
jgi:phenylalanyl-tRNA synthetase beta chain